MATEGLHTIRVITSLRALKLYLGQAAHIAGGVQASESLKLELEAPSPVLNEVLWQGTGKTSIRLADLLKNPKARVFGDYLTRRDDNDRVVSDLTSFKLVGPSNTTLDAQVVTAKSDGELEATLTITGTPPLGSYEARVVRADGLSAVLLNACTITKDKTPPDTSTTGGVTPPKAAD